MWPREKRGVAKENLSKYEVTFRKFSKKGGVHPMNITSLQISSIKREY